ncbi:MAG: arylesterase [Acidobacteria bacterium]|nr:arylesterase [Acidobacteriota bacterium]MBI3422607.1 arylesterase [Acidobacteriota bacterium]
MPCRKSEFKSHLSLAGVFLLLALAVGLSGCQTTPSATKVAEPGAPAVAVAPLPAEKGKDKDARPVIVAFGDSLTAGYGLAEAESYTALLQQRLDAAGYQFRVVNAGVSGDTSAGGARRLEWSLEGDVRYLILELGGNDGLRGLPVAELKKNLAQIIEAAQRRKIMVILAGMEAPPNLGAAYANSFRQVYRELARQYSVLLIPFVLAGVGGDSALNQPDGIHPNAAGEKVFTENVWRALAPVLAKGKP